LSKLVSNENQLTTLIARAAVTEGGMPPSDLKDMYGCLKRAKDVVKKYLNNHAHKDL